ncbi:MAG: ABC transporter ATP-binding protein [Planctomycetota bacterium]|nr:ABC transporter ATP-binding protein [Planctomycetota bacterium]
MTTDLALDLHDVQKTYSGGVQALRGVAMQVRRGEIFGLLGPNGAGKSTLVKILMTVISATHAKGTILGEPLGRKSTLARVGYLPEHHRFPEYLTGRQVVEFFGALANVPRKQRKQRAGELLEFVGMSRWAETRVRQYSKGMRQRVGIAQALVNAPQLVLLDEPTDGVDPVGRRDIREMVHRLKEAGTSVVLNSHLLSELEMVCERVAILVKGKVAAQGTLDELTVGRQRYDVEVDAASAAEGVLAAIAAQTPGTTLAGATFTFGAADPAPVQPLVDRLRAAGIVIRAVKPIRPSLEDLFMQAVTDPTSGKVLTPGAAEANEKESRK